MKLLLLEDWLKSVHQDQGIPKEKETQIRREIIQFMKQLGQYLMLSPQTQGKACYIFHAYSHQVSFKQFNRFLYGSAAIFLAAKIDDFPKELEKVAKFYLASQSLIEEQQQQVSKQEQGIEEAVVIKPQEQPYLQAKDIAMKLEKCQKFDDKVIQETKESLCEAEVFKTLIIFKTLFQLKLLSKIGYDLDIELPYKYVDLFKTYHQLDKCWLQVASSFINDSFYLNICLYYQPYIIALTALKMTSVYFGKEIPVQDTGSQKKWFQFFFDDTEENDIEETQNLMKVIYYKQKQ